MEIVHRVSRRVRTWSVQIPGMALIGGGALLCLLLAQLPFIQQRGLSALILALLLGIGLGNLAPGLETGRCAPSVRWAQRVALRAGVALYGAHLDLNQLIALGWRGVAVDMLMMGSTLVLGVVLGVRLFGLQRNAAILVAAGSAICGAAAVAATAPMLPKTKEHAAHTAAALGAVLVFGSLALLLYPFLRSLLGMSTTQFGVFVGSTVHEVAQVVAIGHAIDAHTGELAMLAKMIRVMLLMPFLLLLGSWARRQQCDADAQAQMPWFAFGFLGCVLMKSVLPLPVALIGALALLAHVLLVLAMLALGLSTTWIRLRQASGRALCLGGVLFVWLVGAGAGVNHLLLG